MKEQHKEMLRRLKSGAFDDRLGLAGKVEAAAAVKTPSPSPVAEPAAAPAAADLPLPIATPASTSAKQQSLDDIIFDFLTSGEKK
jgi:hypothetical protein